jgi:predicted MFS family arabinose efflux permease
MFKSLKRGDYGTVGVDRLSVLVGAILINTAAGQTLVVLPGFVQGLIQYAGFSPQQAGFIASAETSGIALSTVLMTFVVTRVRWRPIFLISLLLVVIGNLASMGTRNFLVFCALRGFAGLGAGALIALTYGVLGMTKNSDRNFGLSIMIVMSYGAGVFFVMPALYGSLGLAGILLLFAGLGAVGLPLIRFMPDSGDAHDQARSSNVPNLQWPLKLSALLAVLCFFLANFAVWSYFYRMGIAAGVGPREASNELAISQFFGIAGAFTTAILGTRLGRLAPITFGILISVACIACLLGRIGPIAYGVIAACYVYVWNMTHPYLFGAMASLDRRGSMVVYATAMKSVGTSFAPAVAALVITGANYANVIWMGIAVFVFSLTLVMPPLLAQVRLLKREPRQHFMDCSS